jgi:hypothetical protein
MLANNPGMGIVDVTRSSNRAGFVLEIGGDDRRKNFAFDAGLIHQGDTLGHGLVIIEGSLRWSGNGRGSSWLQPSRGS